VHTADAWTALADPTRRGILARVTRRPSSVTDLARDLPVSRPAVSQHLHVLLDARLVDVRRLGRQRIYAARPDGLESLRRELEAFWTQLMANLKRVAEESYRNTEE
jgi:DNA-binding transcriptional ArsR family regulator